MAKKKPQPTVDLVMKSLAEMVDRHHTEQDGQERAKVLLSIGVDDLKMIDEHAKAAGMSRSAYLAQVGRQGALSTVGVIEAVEKLKAELKRFETDNAGWRGEVKRLQDHNINLQQKIDTVIGFANELLNTEPETVSAEVASRARDTLKAMKG